MNDLAKAEAAEIEAEYKNQVREGFAAMIQNAAGQTGGAEQFAKWMALIRRCRQEALAIVESKEF